MPHILFLEDEPDIRKGIAQTLRDMDHTVTTCADLVEFEAALGDDSAAFDLLILDRNVPDHRGRTSDSRNTLVKWRRKGFETPAIFMSGARTSNESVIEGVKGGLSEKYLTKEGPYEDLLFEYVSQVLTSKLAVSTLKTKGRWSIDEISRTVRVFDKAVVLPETPFETFKCLFDAYQPSSAAEYNYVSLEKWNLSGKNPRNGLSQRISRLRQAFEEQQINDVVKSRVSTDHRSVAYALVP